MICPDRVATPSKKFVFAREARVEKGNPPPGGDHLYGPYELMLAAPCFLPDTIVCTIPSTRLLRLDGQSIEPVRVRISRTLHEGVDGIMSVATPSAVFAEREARGTGFPWRDVRPANSLIWYPGDIYICQFASTCCCSGVVHVPVLYCCTLLYLLSLSVL